MKQIVQEPKNPFQSIPEEYQIQMKCLDSIVLKKIYSKFIFKYLNFSSSTENKESIETFLANYLNEHKLITIEITACQKNKKNEKNEKTNFSSQKVNSIICIEGYCLIIEEIELSIIHKIMKETKSSIFNVSECNEYKKQQTLKDEEINNFCDQFISANQIKSNKFAKYTIKTIITYLMQRYYFPSDYFKDPFFL